MIRHSQALFVLLVVVLLSCPSIGAQTPEPISTPYELESLMSAVIQLDWFAMSADYYFQFVEIGDHIFEDQLTRLFGLETTPYQPMQRTRLTSAQGWGLEKGLIELGDEGSWWQVRQDSEYGEIEYEVLLSPERVPLLIRYRNPWTGTAHQVPTLIGESLAGIRGQMTPQQIRAALDEELGDDLSRQLQHAFGAPQIVGEELVETPAGQFTAVHVRDAASVNPPGVTDYWLSPEVPGGILRISSLFPGTTKPIITELKEIGKATRLIDPATIVPVTSAAGDENICEGSPTEPVEITVDEYRVGSVGPEEVSYYSLYVPERADVYVEISELQGEAELYFYGTDSSYEDWLSGSSGSTLSMESYFVPAGTTLYFTVVDIADDSGPGEGYMISATADFLLDSTGVRMRGDYQKETKTLYPGGRFSLTLGSQTLEYYKSVADKAGAMVIQATGLPEETMLGFADVDGGYSSVGWEAADGVQTLRVTGLAAGDVCYFYVVGAPWTAGTEFHASVSLE